MKIKTGQGNMTLQKLIAIYIHGNLFTRPRYLTYFG